MTVKEYLDRPYKIKQKLKYLNLELERYEVMMRSIRSPKYDADRVDKSPSTDTPNMKGLERFYETKEKIAKLERELEIVVEEIEVAIDQLENDEYKLLLKYKYLSNLTWNEIVDKMYYGYSTIRRWHSLAIKLINVEFNLNN